MSDQKENDENWGDSAITETDLHKFSEDTTYAGVTSFLRRPYRKDLEGIDVAIIGVPFDTATTNRPGTRFGPRGIRAASSLLSYERLVYGWDFHPISEMAIVDHGDLPFDFSKPAEVPAAIEAYAKKIVEAGVMMMTLGGDHFISYPLLKAHAARHGAPLSIIHFDAHSDTWEDENEDGINHGTMFWYAVREGLIDPATSVQIGLRTVNLDTMGFNILDAPWVHRHGTDAVIAEARRIVGDKKAYLTFDIDCLDPSYAPGTGTPSPGGLTTNQAFEIVQGLAGLNIIGADLVEVSPPYDVAEITALAGAQLVTNFLCLFARAPWRTAE
ncbi:MAG: agmatinase [Deltaproteobacteria bacterium]|nr:agmatinase [Deltaproteobacteria bacterium]